MRRGALLASSLVLGLASFASADEAPMPWYKRWFGFRFSTVKTNPARQEKEKAEAIARPAAMNQPMTDARADYLRRVEVCLKLRTIALAKGDEELARQADQLEQQAWDVFVQANNNGGISAEDAVLTKTLKSDTETSTRNWLRMPSLGSGRTGDEKATASRKEER